MRVVLLKDIENLGKKYDVKDVKDGYARNFLMPKGLVKLADKQAVSWAQEQKANIKEQAEQDLEKAGKMASSLDGLEVEVPVKVGDQEQLFETINAQKISTVLKEMGYDIHKNQIEMEEIDEIGEFEAKIKFPHNLEASIKVLVIAQEQ